MHCTDLNFWHIDDLDSYYGRIVHTVPVNSQMVSLKQLSAQYWSLNICIAVSHWTLPNVSIHLSSLSGNRTKQYQIQNQSNTTYRTKAIPHTEPKQYHIQNQSNTTYNPISRSFLQLTWSYRVRQWQRIKHIKIQHTYTDILQINF
jgi:hypothetical protein